MYYLSVLFFYTLKFNELWLKAVSVHTLVLDKMLSACAVRRLTYSYSSLVLSKSQQPTTVSLTQLTDWRCLNGMTDKWWPVQPPLYISFIFPTPLPFFLSKNVTQPYGSLESINLLFPGQSCFQKYFLFNFIYFNIILQ